MKKMLYKLFGLGIVSLLGLSSIIGLVNAQNAGPTTQTWGDSFGNGAAATNVGINNAGNLQGDGLVTSIKKFIQRTLGILSLITLVILLRGGFQMVTAAGDDTKYKQGMKILKQAGFGLAFIGLSRLMVSMIFRLIGSVAGA